MKGGAAFGSTLGSGLGSGLGRGGGRGGRGAGYASYGYATEGAVSSSSGRGVGLGRGRSSVSSQGGPASSDVDSNYSRGGSLDGRYVNPYVEDGVATPSSSARGLGPDRRSSAAKGSSRTHSSESSLSKGGERAQGLGFYATRELESQRTEQRVITAQASWQGAKGGDGRGRGSKGGCGGSGARGSSGDADLLQRKGWPDAYPDWWVGQDGQRGTMTEQMCQRKYYAMNREIMECNDAWEILDYCDVHLAEFNQVNVVTAFHRVAKHEKARGKDDIVD